MDPVVVQPFVDKILQMGVFGLQSHYKQQSDYKSPNQITIAYNANLSCNRYNYVVVCQDENRVVLENTGRSNDYDYIHANYFASPNSTRRMIATQAPTKVTMGDFWRMIIQEDCENVLMLCQIYESGLEKSSQYWPRKIGELMKYGEITVKNLGSNPTATDKKLILSSLQLDVKTANGVKTKFVKHYQYLGWPDQSVPKDFSTVIEMAIQARKSSTTITVHCSAGIGRTGVMVGVMLLMDKIQAKVEVHPDTLIQEIRNQRAMAIQHEEQFVFIFKALLYYFVEELKMFDHIEDIQTKYKEFSIDYQHMMSPDEAL